MFFFVMGTFKTSMSCSHWKHHHLSMYFYVVMLFRENTHKIYIQHTFSTMWVFDPSTGRPGLSISGIVAKMLAAFGIWKANVFGPTVSWGRSSSSSRSPSSPPLLWVWVIISLSSKDDHKLCFPPLVKPPKFTQSVVLLCRDAPSGSSGIVHQSLRRSRHQTAGVFYIRHHKKTPSKHQKKTSDLQIMLRKPIWEAEHLAIHCATVLLQEVCKTLEWMSKQNLVFRNLRSSFNWLISGEDVCYTYRFLYLYIQAMTNNTY